MTDICRKILRTDIGHYGGLFVDVPAEHWKEFKGAFPTREFPRKPKLKSVTKTMTTEGEARFHKKFPKSYGNYYDVFFADRSKGLKRLDKMIDKCPRSEIARIRRL